MTEYLCKKLQKLLKMFVEQSWRGADIDLNSYRPIEMAIMNRFVFEVW